MMVCILWISRKKHKKKIPNWAKAFHKIKIFMHVSTDKEQNEKIIKCFGTLKIFLAQMWKRLNRI